MDRTHFFSKCVLEMQTSIAKGAEQVPAGSFAIPEVESDPSHFIFLKLMIA
jgi:hypothetical protein